MAGARSVITNFFHGCIFAVLNGKPWAAAPSDYRSIKIPDLANALGAQHRIVDEQTSDADVFALLDAPRRPQVSERLSEYRGRSEAYLYAALS
jgi:exopolysaccharide biosynthesis predicted pyruvyltransferase EpsI